MNRARTRAAATVTMTQVLVLRATTRSTAWRAAMIVPKTILMTVAFG